MKFPRHSFGRILKIKKNGKFTLFTSSTSIHPATKTFGKWKKSNDTILLLKKRIVIFKHIRNKKMKKSCNETKNNKCKIDTLIIEKNGITELNGFGKFEKMEN